MTAEAGGRAAPAVSVEDLEFRYDVESFSLHVPHLVIERGEHVALIGPSGCGKTTFLHLISGVLRPHAGRVSVGGEEVTALSDAGRRRLRVKKIGMVFQEFELLEHLTVAENVRLPYLVHPALEEGPAVRQRLLDLAAAVGLEGLLSRRPRRLSQGERQRVAICRALLPGPELVLADEPTGNLDPATKRRVLDLLVRQATEAGASLVLVTHDHGLLDAFDRVVDFAPFAVHRSAT